ncbi:MAG: hypothetical protein IKD76_04815 [Clostridia bacterium]|nr:hypothetical protein [Clostridia bacterium]
MEYENEEKTGKKILKIIIALIIVAALLAGGAFAIKVAPNYISNDITDRTNLVINYSNVTGRMKNELIVDSKGVVYLSLNDIMNYYDRNIYYDEQYNQIVTSTNDKVAVLKLDENEITINGKVSEIKGSAMVKNKIYYLPISEMEEVYNIKITKPENKVVIESLDRKLTTATTSKKISVKGKTTFFSRTLEKVEQGEKVVITDVEPNTLPYGWVRVRTQNGNLGYVEEKDLNNIHVEREATVYKAPMKEKVSMAWDYFSEYGKAKDNTGVKYSGVNVVSPSFFYLKLEDTKKENLTKADVEAQAKIQENVGDAGVKYIKWAHDNGYKVWAKVSNETMSTTIDEFSCIINDYELRKNMIDEIIGYVKKYNLDGINLDFEYMYMDDKDAFSRFIIELAPQLRENGICFSVDVTAPDGGENWSLCYDRNVIGEKTDYVVFMGYDQYGTSVIGTTSGYNWLENNIKKFIGQEEVPSEKIILGLPFYTKLWQTKDGTTIKGTAISMKSVAESIPSGASKEWLEDVQQYYVQYDKNGYTYKMWVEDEKSFAKKMDLINDYNLAGAAYWRKDLESNEIWTVIKEKLKLQK